MRGVLGFLVAPALRMGTGPLYFVPRSEWERDVVAITVRFRGQAEAPIHPFISDHQQSIHHLCGKTREKTRRGGGEGGTDDSVSLTTQHTGHPDWQWTGPRGKGSGPHGFVWSFDIIGWVTGPCGSVDSPRLRRRIRELPSPTDREKGKGDCDSALDPLELEKEGGRGPPSRVAKRASGPAWRLVAAGPAGEAGGCAVCE
jgi:hypothetical protein